MKKILLGIGLFLIFNKVYAFEEGVWTDEVLTDPNVLITSSEIRYKWYQNIRHLSPEYYIEGENDAIYPNIYSDDFIQTNFNEWGEGKPLSKANRIIESRGVGRYHTLRPIRYLFLENIIGGYTTFNISEFNVLINNSKTPVNMTCISCSPNFLHDINDGLYTNKAYINNGGSLKIDLGAYYGIEQIKLELFMYDTVPNTKKFDLYFNEGDTLLDRNYAHKEIAFYVISDNIDQPERHLIMPDRTFIVNAVYNDWIYIDDSVNTTYYREMQYICQYRYKDIKYSYYGWDRSYLEGYYESVDDISYIKDENSAKTFYQYKQSVKDDGLNNVEVINQQAVGSEITTKNEMEEPLTIGYDTSLNIETSNQPIISEDPMVAPPTGNDLLAIRDTDSKEISKKDKPVCWLTVLNYKLILMCLVPIIFLIIILFRIRHHNLSHQK